MKKFFLAVALFAAAGAAAQELVPIDKTPVYRRSFTARYELIGGGPVREAALSPDGTRVGYVRDNDLFVREIATGAETRITSDGERNRIINGATDWVYEEEYAFTRAWEFSPDSRRIAWLRFDESLVPEFSMMRYDERLYPEAYTYKYPKAGERNSVVTLHVHDLATGRTRQVDTGPQTDQYIPRIGWTPSGERGTDSKLFFYRVNRLQNHFEVVLADGREPHGRVIYSETSPTYVERPDEGTVVFDPDGEHFTVRSETRTGEWERYLYSIEDGLVEMYAGEEDGFAGVDDWNERVTDGRRFFSFGRNVSSNEPRISAKGRRGTGEGDNADGGLGVDENSDIVELYGWMMTPEGFDPERAEKYPVFMTQYSGPGSESVFVETIGAGDMSIYRPLLDAGYIVACVDPRGTGGRGEGFKKSTYGQLGKLETEDQIAAARWLGALPYVDPARIGIYGWSYGGFIALNSILKGADVFKAAVAVAPVTSWRYYDTIYTEIYNGLPADNPAGYDENSPINYAGLLRGKLLLIHGTGDDNVHVQNSMEMAKALVAADRQFDMMIYPDDNHSMWPSGGRHVRRKIVDWVIENL